MKKVLLFLSPLLIAIIVFIVITYFLDKNSGKGALEVTSKPQSNIFLNGKLVGKTPFCMGSEKCAVQDRLNVGEYSIKLIPLSGNYNEYDAKIPINKSTVTFVERNFQNGASSSGSIITLSPVSDKKDAQILIVSFPDKADIFLDNSRVDITPKLIENVTESEHDLLVSKNGYFNKLLKIKATLGYKLTSLIFLGINPDFSTPSSTPSATPTPTTLPAPQKVIILNTPTGFLRVRMEASIASAEIDRVHPAEVYELLDEKDGWFKIKLKDGKTGWVSIAYAKKE